MSWKRNLQEKSRRGRQLISVERRYRKTLDKERKKKVEEERQQAPEPKLKLCGRCEENHHDPRQDYCDDCETSNYGGGLDYSRHEE